MTMKLRQIPDGTRFVLCRTGQRFTLLRRETVKNRRRIVVVREGEARESSLSHQCHVKPIVRAKP